MLCAQLMQLIVVHHLSTDEALLKVSVDGASSLQGHIQGVQQQGKSVFCQLASRESCKHRFGLQPQQWQQLLACQPVLQAAACTPSTSCHSFERPHNRAQQVSAAASRPSCTHTQNQQIKTGRHTPHTCGAFVALRICQHLTSSAPAVKK
jgi:hypothetical protein